MSRALVEYQAEENCGFSDEESFVNEFHRPSEEVTIAKFGRKIESNDKENSGAARLDD